MQQVELAAAQHLLKPLFWRKSCKELWSTDSGNLCFKNLYDLQVNSNAMFCLLLFEGTCTVHHSSMIKSH
jgi:hypothetical protein